MDILKITVPLHDGETPVSFGARLAQANGRERVWDFAMDVGLDFQGVVDGRTTDIGHLASLGGCSPAALVSWAAVKVKSGTMLRGEEVGLRTLRRAQVFACPSCLTADLADEAIDLEARPWGRAVWQVSALRTCRIHDQALAEIGRTVDPRSIHDFTALALIRSGDLPELDNSSERRAPSRLEEYVHGRLADGLTCGGYLDGFPLYAVMRMSENFGAVLTFGRKVRLEDLGENELHEACSTGFESVEHGEQGIRAALTRLQSTFLDGSFDWGPRAMFGRLYEWLAHENDDPVYDPIRDIIESHVVETMPIGPGETILNRQVTVRRIHSLHSAALEHGLHPKRLRKLLIQSGHVRPGDEDRTDGRVLFPVEVVEGLLVKLSDTLSLIRAGQYINAPRPHERLLYEAGFIEPIIAGGTDVLKDHAVLRSDLDTFMSRLTALARPDISGLTIPAAARRANCAAMEIVGLLLEGRLTKVGLDPGSRGYLSVLIDVDEVKAMVRREEHGGLSLRAVEKRMTWSTQVLTALIDHCLLPSAIAVNPVNRCPQRIITESDLADFDRSFVTLHALAMERGQHFRRLKKELAMSGIEPDPIFTNIPATFYRRALLPEPAAV